MDRGSMVSLAARAPTQRLVSSQPGAGPPNARTPFFSFPHIVVKVGLLEEVSGALDKEGVSFAVGLDPCQREELCCVDYQSARILPEI